MRTRPTTAQAPLPFLPPRPAAAPPTPAKAPPRPSTAQPTICACRNAEGPFCGALARDGGTPVADHIRRGGGQDGCPGYRPGRPARTPTKETP